MTWFADDVVKVEVRFDGSTWVNLSSPTNYVILSEPLQIERGRDDEFADPMNPGVLELLLVNDDGRFTPDLPTSPYYPYVVPDVEIKVSVYVNSAWQTRFYGSVQSWSVRLGDEGGYTSTCAVTATDTLGDFPEYVFRQAADEVVRSVPGVLHHWPLRDTESPARPLIGSIELTAAAEPSTPGWGAGGLLALDEGTDQHPLFKSAAGGLTLSTPELIADTNPRWSLYFVLTAAPTANCTLLRFYSADTPMRLIWDTVAGLSIDVVGLSVMPTQWPVLVQVPRNTTSAPTVAVGYADGTSAASAYGVGGPRSVRALTINPTLSGGAQWSISHLFVVDTQSGGAGLGATAQALFGSRTISAEAAPEMISRLAGGPTISGAIAGETTLPALEGQGAADVMASLAAGMGARIRANGDGTLTWIPFGDGTTPTALPAEKVDPALVWETTDIGWCSDATVSRYDGSSYTATRADGRRKSISIEGVHATWLGDRSYADWLVNTASTKARLSAATYEISSLSATDQAILVGVKVGDRITIGSLPTAILPASLTLIVEGVTDSISDDGWLITFKTSPDVYSRLFILDDPVQGVLDSGYLLAP